MASPVVTNHTLNHDAVLDVPVDIHRLVVPTVVSAGVEITEKLDLSTPDR